MDDNFESFSAIQNCYSQETLKLTELSFLLEQAVKRV